MSKTFEKKRDESRKYISEKVKEIRKEHNNILLEFATGTGKTKQALDISEGKTLIVHAEVSHKQNIIDEMLKHKMNLKDFYFVTYKSIHKLDLSQYKTIIWDEVHHITYPIQKFFKSFKYKGSCIFLSASVPKNKRKLIEDMVSNLCTYVITLKKAVELCLVHIPNIKVHWLELTDAPTEYIIDRPPLKTTQVITYDNLKDHNVWNKRTIVKCTEKEYYEILNKEYSETYARYEKAYNMFLNQEVSLDDYKKAKFFKDRAGLKRKNFISKYKFEYTKKLFNSLKGKKLLFTDSIDSSLEFPNYTNSKLSAKINNEVIKSFKEGKINSLAVVQMLKESHNIPDLDHVINQQVDFSGFISFIQIQGRALRGRDTIYHVIFLKDTIDEDIFNNLLENDLI